MTDETIARKLAEGTGSVSTMTDERPDEYNGWTNRETWATALHIDNDQGTYELRNEWVSEARVTAENSTRTAEGVLADMIENWLDELAADVIEGELTSREARMMLDEIGSRFRVNYREIAENWLSE